MKDGAPRPRGPRYARRPMRARMSSLGPGVGPGLALVVGLGGCAFHPDGGTPVGGDDGDGGVIGDAGDGEDAAVPGVDARLVDATVADARPAFDPETCPDGYAEVLGQPSRYRIIDPVGWLGAQVVCKGHSAGLTHLAVFSGTGERDGVGAALFFGGEFRRTWIGVWHDGAGPRTVTGEALYPSTAVTVGQAVSWVRDLIAPFRADSVGTPFAAVCECDGLGSTP